MTTELATVAPSAQSSQALASSVFATAQAFEHAQRAAKLIASSELIPKAFQGKVADCVLALEMANRLGASPLAVIQNLYVVHGRPSWSSQFLMGMVNSCGRFSPLEFETVETGTPRTVTLEIEAWTGYGQNREKKTRKQEWTYTPTTCRAWATSTRTGKPVYGPPVSYDMALQEGWVSRDGSKWLTEMRSLMLIYRAGAFFAKIHASDITLGMQTQEEIYDLPPGSFEVLPAKGPEIPAPIIFQPKAKEEPPAQPTEAAPRQETQEKPEEAPQQPEPAPQTEDQEKKRIATIKQIEDALRPWKLNMLDIVPALKARRLVVASMQPAAIIRAPQMALDKILANIEAIAAETKEAMEGGQPE